MSIIRQSSGATTDGTLIERYTLANRVGVETEIMTYGGIIVVLRTPDRQGRQADITLGFATLVPYLTGNPFFGALVGRYGNRIAGGAFHLDGRRYHLATNNGPNHLHGGRRGFDKVIWAGVAEDRDSESRLTLRYVSPDGDEGYPGTLVVTVTYTLTDANELRLDYHATTDQPTILNLTNHTYFNLAGGGDVLGHELQLFASHFLPVDATLIPTGELRSVRGTPMDFTTPTTIGARFGIDDAQLQLALGGYDHCWVLDGDDGRLASAARVYEPTSGRTLEVLTTQPGVQFYTGNFLDGSFTGRDGQVYRKHAGFCLETQHFPDSPNQPAFPSTALRPDAPYHQTTIFRFGARPA